MPDYCSVVGCSEARGKQPGVRFFRFPQRNKEQRELWVKAVRRQSSVGNSLWMPYETAVVCSRHFVLGKPSPTRTHPDYIPSIFPTSHRVEATDASIQRHLRAKRRRDYEVEAEAKPVQALMVDESVQVCESELPASECLRADLFLA